MSSRVFSLPVFTAQYRANLDPGGIDDDVLDALPLPCVGHVDETVLCLDDGGVAKLRLFFLFQYSNPAPLATILRDRKIQHPSASPP